ncbi:hypothetical protein V8C42DRAFT_341018 [Trichoderma barbatum]
MASIADRVKAKVGRGKLTSQLPLRVPKRKRTIYGADEDEGDDGDSNDNPNSINRPLAKKRIMRCGFCADDPEGQRMRKDRECDYTSNPGSDHKCQVPKVGKVWRQYGTADPSTYTPSACDQCLDTNLAKQCDVDSILGWRSHPSPPQRSVVGWLRDRTTWDQPCLECQSNNLAALNGGHLVAELPRPTLPKTWVVDLNSFDRGFIECRPTFPHRRNCQRCHLDGHQHCRADAGSYGHACNRCAQLGIDCIDSEDGIHYPIFDLARVGIGKLMPFTECSCCARTGRNCDLQRPCDSCVHHGDQCDEWKGETAKCCFNGRLEPSPGPLYYLALGYGAQGVDDPKDGSSIEHWVGPAINIYSMPRDQQRKQLTAALGVHMRGHTFAQGAPPHGDAAQGGLIPMQASKVTREQIVSLIKANWPEASPMNQLPQYQRLVNTSRRCLHDIRDGKDIKNLVRQFRGNKDNDNDNSSHNNIVDTIDISGDDEEEVEEVNDDGNNDTSMEDANGLDDERRARLDAAGMAGARALSRATLLSPTLNTAAVPVPIILSDDDNTVAPDPVHTDIDINSLYDLMDFTYDNVMDHQGGALQMELSDLQFNFDVAAPSHQMIADGRFSLLDAIDVDVDMETDVYPDLDTAGVDFDLVQVDADNLDIDANIDPSLQLYVDFNPLHVPADYINTGLYIDPNLYATNIDDDSIHAPANDTVRDTNIDPNLFAANINPSPPRVSSNGFNRNSELDLNGDLSLEHLRLYSTILDRDSNSGPPLFDNTLQEGVAASLDDNTLDQMQNMSKEIIPTSIDIVQAQLGFGDTSPFYNVLGTIPSAINAYERSNDFTCLEKTVDGTCNNPLSLDSICQCSSHGQDFVHVCNSCSQASMDELFNRKNNPFNLAAIENMRAYLCHYCAMNVSADIRDGLKDILRGNVKVWGLQYMSPESQSASPVTPTPGGTITSMGKAMRITGCSCGRRLLTQRLCRDHRLKYCDEVVSQAQRMQEWRERKSGFKACPICSDESQPRRVGFEDNEWVLKDAECVAWQCLICRDLVVNQPKMGIVGYERPTPVAPAPQASTTGNRHMHGGQDEGHQPENKVLYSISYSEISLKYNKKVQMEDKIHGKVERMKEGNLVLKVLPNAGISVRRLC